MEIGVLSGMDLLGSYGVRNRNMVHMYVTLLFGRLLLFHWGFGRLLSLLLLLSLMYPLVPSAVLFRPFLSPLFERLLGSNAVEVQPSNAM